MTPIVDDTTSDMMNILEWRHKHKYDDEDDDEKDDGGGDDGGDDGDNDFPLCQPFRLHHLTTRTTTLTV
jgi:hypothetical protein